MTKKPVIANAQGSFEKELEIFRTEEEVAQQYFFAYLSVRNLARQKRRCSQDDE
jgi:hypothetical protein